MKTLQSIQRRVSGLADVTPAKMPPPALATSSNWKGSGITGAFLWVRFARWFAYSLNHMVLTRTLGSSRASQLSLAFTA